MHISQEQIERANAFLAVDTDRIRPTRLGPKTSKRSSKSKASSSYANAKGGSATKTAKPRKSHSSQAEMLKAALSGHDSNIENDSPAHPKKDNQHSLF